MVKPSPGQVKTFRKGKENQLILRGMLQSNMREDEPLKLPEPRYDSEVSIEKALLERRSVRKYTGEPLTLQEVSQLLWAAQGISDSKGHRTAPSGRAAYSVGVYMVAGNVQGLPASLYRYKPAEHELIKVADRDSRAELAKTTLKGKVPYEQPWVKEGAIDIILTGVYDSLSEYLGDDRGIRSVHMEVGHIAQNIYLQVAALQLGMVVVANFLDEPVTKILGLPQNEQPLYLIPVGRKMKE